VIANNDEDGFYIISDTRIILGGNRFPSQVPIELKKNIETYGMVKSIIIGGKIVFCFAGNNINNADKVAERIRELYYVSGNTYEDIYDEVLNFYNSSENINDEGEHICDYILAFLINDKVVLNVFKDVAIGSRVNKCYIGNCDVYKGFHDLDVDRNISKPVYIGNDAMIVEVITNIKFTPVGDIEQDTDLLKSKMQELKSIVDSGFYNDVDSPVIGVYYNTQRKQFEYYYDKIYEVHGQVPSNGQDTPITITQYTNGENYEVKPFKHTEGLIIYNYTLNSSVAYLCTDIYLKEGITDYNNLLLPISFDGFVDENNIMKVRDK
jgi:hypothetical protein